MTMSTHVTITPIKIQMFLLPPKVSSFPPYSIPVHPHQKHILIQREEVFWTRLGFLFTNLYQALCTPPRPRGRAHRKGVA